MARIYLVSPTLQANVQMPSVNESYSLGLAYLHAVIEQAGHEITTRNFNHVEQDSAERMIEDDLASLDPEYLLVQVFTMNRVACYRVIEAARRERPHLKIIVGGVHASIFPEQLLTHFAIDYVVIGEGELVWPQLLADWRAGALQPVYKTGSLMEMAQIPAARRDMFTAWSAIRSRSVLIFTAATMARRSVAIGWWSASSRKQRSSISTWS